MAEHSAPHGLKAVVTALCANLLIAVGKIVVFIFTASAAMLAEAIHSLADCADQALLLYGNRRSRRRPDRLHPFGYGREQYFYAFIVSLVLFFVGGCFAINEAVQKIRQPHLIEGSVWLPAGILIFALVLETYSLFVALRESRAVKGKKSYARFVLDAKNPELIVCLMEDAAAVLGLIIALISVLAAYLTGNPLFDAIGSGLIGLILIFVALVLGVQMKSLLIGESADEETLALIERELVGGGIRAVIHNKTVHLSADNLLVAVKVETEETLDAAAVAAEINKAEARIRAALPQFRLAVYLEPDTYAPRP
ncbi:MAG: cation diffusion facilitator family transporter [Gracilibacteraceae bacterium]|jgi:cation diffusion facilitator family transporter|nr:cation diffusion facilitator family transporter [Gracilibacteraceae bacterium]